MEMRDYPDGGEMLKPPAAIGPVDRHHQQHHHLCDADDTRPGRNFADISIAGMSRVCGCSCPRRQRAVWALVLLTCTALMTAQIWDRVSYYLLIPVTVNVRVTRNQTLRFPIVSFCNKNRFNMTAVSILQQDRAEALEVTNDSLIRSWDLPDLLDTPGMNASYLWEFTKHQQQLMVKECWFMRGRRCETVGDWRTIHTVLGVCYQYRVRDPVATSGIFNNMYLLLEDTEAEVYNHDSGFKILIHDPRDDPVIDLRTHGTTLERGWGKDVRVAVREFKTIPTHRRPCVTNQTYSSSQCISRCFLNALYNETRCLMPYMHGLNGTLCNTSKQYKVSLEKERQLLFDGGWSHHQCNCLKQCNEDIYSMYTEAAMTSNAPAKLRVFFQDLTYDEVSEEIAYDAIALLCDIGGTLGLLLGASVLTIIEFLEVFWMKILRR
ncbi:acid-sensing ion channel 1B-like [Panulirus ornatus]|uniref:acid-sensing ion channel 1B-like n=1 Tax=Panulirus ornatus TaxID=150431 RepID=UPI003A8B7C3F